MLARRKFRSCPHAVLPLDVVVSGGPWRGAYGAQCLGPHSAHLVGSSLGGLPGAGPAGWFTSLHIRDVLAHLLRDSGQESERTDSADIAACAFMEYSAASQPRSENEGNSGSEALPSDASASTGSKGHLSKEIELEQSTNPASSSSSATADASPLSMERESEQLASTARKLLVGASKGIAGLSSIFDCLDLSESVQPKDLAAVVNSI